MTWREMYLLIVDKYLLYAFWGVKDHAFALL